MKKFMSILLVLVFVLSVFTACSSTKSNSKTESKNDNKIIELEDVVLLDNESLTISVVNFYEEKNKWENRVDKVITFEIKNKSDHEIYFNLTDLYVGENAADTPTMLDNTSTPPGKSKKCRFIINNVEFSDEIAVEKLEDLYNLEGNLSILYSYDDETKNSNYYEPFNINEAINGKAENKEINATIYKIGDTVSTDMVEFTLNGFDYIYHINYRSYEEQETSGRSFGPDDNMVFANPEFTIKNISKSSISAYETVEFTVDYNDGYKYNMYDGMSYIVDSPYVAGKIYSRTSREGTKLEIPSLMSEDYEMYFSANSLIETDKDAKVLLIVNLPNSSNSTQEFVFKIK